ncbi:hypothetical protein [Geodermatophilus sp. SYSU D01036]
MRADLAGPRVVPRRLYAAAEVVSRAADLCCESAELVRDNERRWRVTRDRTEQLVRAITADPGQTPAAAGDGAPGGRGQPVAGTASASTETTLAEDR